MFSMVQVCINAFNAPVLPLAFPNRNACIIYVHRLYSHVFLSVSPTRHWQNRSYRTYVRADKYPPNKNIPVFFVCQELLSRHLFFSFPFSLRTFSRALVYSIFCCVTFVSGAHRGSGKSFDFWNGKWRIIIALLKNEQKIQKRKQSPISIN